MRWLIPNYRYPDSFVDNVAHTLTQMGHEVVTAPEPPAMVNEKRLFFVNLIRNRIFPNARSFQMKWLDGRVGAEKFDVLLALTQVVDEDLLQALRAKGTRTIAWWGDTAANMTRQGLLSDGWDFVFIKDRYAAFKLGTLGLNSHYLPEAMNPAWHKPVAQQANDDVVFAGNAYDYRNYLIRKLAAAGVEHIKLYGSGVPRWADEAAKRAYTGKYIIREEKSRVFGEALTVINSTAMSEGNSLNCRTFEIAGAGGLQILEYRDAVHDCFEPGKEILTYNSFPELLEHLDRYRRDRAAAARIREAGQQRAHSEHTYRHRIEQLIKTASL